MMFIILAMYLTSVLAFWVTASVLCWLTGPHFVTGRSWLGFTLLALLSALVWPVMVLIELVLLFKGRRRLDKIS